MFHVGQMSMEDADIADGMLRTCILSRGKGERIHLRNLSKWFITIICECWFSFQFELIYLLGNEIPMQYKGIKLSQKNCYRHQKISHEATFPHHRERVGRGKTRGSVAQENLTNK